MSSPIGTGWAVTWSLLLVVGCVSIPGGETQPVHTFLLSQDREGEELGRHGTTPVADVVLIGVPKAQPGFDSAQMAYMQRPYEVLYYSSNQWVDPPARMLVPLLMQAIERRGVARAVVALPSSVRGALRLDVDQLLMVQDFFQQPSRTRVKFRTQLVRLPEQVVIGSRVFEDAESAPTEDAYGGAVAGNRALGRILDGLGTWVEACLKSPTSGCDN